MQPLLLLSLRVANSVLTLFFVGGVFVHAAELMLLYLKFEVFDFGSIVFLLRQQRRLFLLQRGNRLIKIRYFSGFFLELL